MSDHSSSGTDRDEDYLVTVDSETHKGEWLRMVTCPIPYCNAVLGEDYERFSSHLAAEHGPEDVGLSSDGPRVATDGGNPSSGIEQSDDLGVTNECDNCSSGNISGQVHCAVCGGLVNDV